MTEVQRIVKQFDMVMEGAPWHGDAIWKILEGISPECAAHRTLAHSHSIWEIVLHMTVWEAAGVRRLAGERDGVDEAFNFPAPPEATEANWQKTLDGFRASNQAFRQALEGLRPEKLDELSAAGKRTYYDEAHGVIQHDVYHAGQVAILKKDFQQRKRPAGL